LCDQKEEEIASIIGAFVRKNRKSLRLTSDEVSEMCKIDNSTLSQIENGRRVPKLETLVRIVSYFMRVAEEGGVSKEVDRLKNSMKDFLQQLGGVYKEVD